MHAAESAGAEVVLGDWIDETSHRRFALEDMRRRGFEYVLIPDGDEVVEPKLLENLIKIAEADLADVVRVRMDTYWKSAEYVIRPREELAPILLLKTSACHHLHIREYEGPRLLVLSPEHGVLHHLSYVGPSERIVRKISTWGHKSEVTEGWYERVWLGWDNDKLMRELHPTHPFAYGFAERITPASVLKGLATSSPSHVDPRPDGWPSVSVVIPLYGGPEDIAQCLESLAKCQDLLHETLVVDDVSPDDAPEVVGQFGFAKLIRNETNLGFAGTCNAGLTASTGEVVIFLNSDTIVPRVALIRLVQSLMVPGVAAAGPFTNNAGHHQLISPTYTSIDTLDLFAEDFAQRPNSDADVDMLVGFCLAVRKSVLNEIGGFDERFKRGMFEDNDLSYRMRREGHRLVIASRSYIHHHGSRSLNRSGEDTGGLFHRNKLVYDQKWKADVESGFASHLAGYSPQPIVFNWDRHPEKLALTLKAQARAADISLCMIVKNEERVLSECLQSAKPYFKQIILVDTGSTDRTVEIAKEAGAEVHVYPWTDSFSDARNQSLKYATGRWIFWMDADDTLPMSSGEILLRAATEAPEDVIGFVVPVQFVEEGPGAGTRVDHVKLFRNKPGIGFEGRIHEQILASLRAIGGQIARLDAVVMHSGYDTSVEGQANKRVRDYKLLKLDLEDRPNHPFVLFNLGMTDHYTNEHETAVEWLQKSIDAAAPDESHVRKAYALMAVSLRLLGRHHDSLEALETGLAAVGDDAELRFQAGLLLTEMGRYEEARTYYESIQEDTGGYFTSIDIGILTHKRYFNLGMVCMMLGDYPSAKSWLEKTMEHGPLFVPSAQELFKAALEYSDLRTAQEVMNRFLAVAGPTEEWADLGIRYAEKLGSWSDAEQFLLEAIRRFPQAPGPRMALARAYLANGNEAVAIRHLLVLEDMGSAEAAFYLGVSATRRGNYQEAYNWMDRAHKLNPNHEDTRIQLENLGRVLSEA